MKDINKEHNNVVGRMKMQFTQDACPHMGDLQMGE